MASRLPGHQKRDFPRESTAMMGDQLPFIFQYPHLSQDMLPVPPTELHSSGESAFTLVPSLGTYRQRVISDTGMVDKDGLELIWSEEYNTLIKAKDAPWYSHAIQFIAQIPQSDTDWSRHVSSNDDIQSLCNDLKLPYLYPEFQSHIDWSRLFDECAQHLARACDNPPLASLFSLIFVAACQVALDDGCPRETVLRGLGSCARHCGMAEDELTELVLDNVREGRCDSACFSFIQKRISSTYRPTVPLQSECLEIPALVYDLLGGEVRYQVIVQILCPEKADGAYGYNSVDMTDVMEFDERDDGG
ncbi:hypothetical protein FLONG3_7262 [Fusarium longipes]|uniref:Uncharacterized protein n=1 Tax=Fusarium longipes TaxID=694270 RepID=A0A395SFA7_9HYPO|nr:hypothetical protein FLONG3_7262 [Fusarium longipes]